MTHERERERLYQPTKLINEGYDEYQTTFNDGKVDLIRRDRAVPIHADTRFAAGSNDGYEIRNGLIYEVKDNIFFGKLVLTTVTIHPTNSGVTGTSFGQIAKNLAPGSIDDAYVHTGRLYTRNSGGRADLVCGCSVYTNHFTNSDDNYRGIPGYENFKWHYTNEGYWGHIYMRSSLKVIDGNICNLDGSKYSGIDVFI